MSELKAYKGDVYIPVYGSIADAEVYIKKDADEVIAQLKQKLEEAQREVNNYRRHANECEGLAAKGDIDKVSLLEEIKDLRNDKELLDSQLYGFLQLEEECGGGDLRNYIAKLNYEASEVNRCIAHHKYKRCLAMARWCETQFAYYIASCDRYDGKYVNKKAGHFYKWKYKWLELAEKFKEAK